MDRIIIIIIILFSVGAIAYFMSEAAVNRELQEAETKLKNLQIADVDYMSGISFENYIAWLLLKVGFSQVGVTQGSRGVGADIIASRGEHKYLIQVKKLSSKVSREVISDVVAAKSDYHCSASMVVTNNYFTESATKYANSVECELIDRDTLASWIMSVSPEPADLLRSATLNENQTQPNKAALPYAKATRSASPIKSKRQAVTSYSGALFHLNVPDNIFSGIKKNAAKKWPDNYAMQLKTIEDEQKSYQRVATFPRGKLPEKVFEGICAAAAQQWPDSYSMQLEAIEEEQQSYKRITTLPRGELSEDVFKSICTAAARQWPDSYSMQVNQIEKELKHLTGFGDIKTSY